MSSLQPCRECGHQVSESAASCPSCGACKPARSRVLMEMDAYDKRDEKQWGPFILTYWLVGLSALGLLAGFFPRPGESFAGSCLGLFVFATGLVALFLGDQRFRDRREAARSAAYDEFRKKYGKKES